MLTFDRVVAGYGTPVIGPISFEVRAGDVLGLAGPNGVGKSTLFRVLTGAARVYGGSVRRGPALRVTYLRQDPSHPEENPLTASDLFVLTGASAAPCPAQVRPLMDRRLDELSGGQLQLVEIWALLGGPANLVLLDEPTRHLDRPGRALLAEWLRQSPRERAVLIISHEAPFLSEVCSRQVSLGGEPAVFVG